MKTDKALAEIKTLTEALQKIGKPFAEILPTLDTITKSHTAFPTFQDLINAKGGFFPSIQRTPKNICKRSKWYLSDGRTISSEMRYAELELLALAYDMAQTARGDSRRAFRS